MVSYHSFAALTAKTFVTVVQKKTSNTDTHEFIGIKNPGPCMPVSLQCKPPTPVIDLFSKVFVHSVPCVQFSSP